MTEAVTFQSGHRDVIHDSQLDYYVRRLATASADGTICVYDLQDGNSSLSSQISGHQSAVYKVSWSHPKFGSLLASCSYDRKIAIWHEESPGSWIPIYEDESFDSPVVSVVFAPEDCGLILAVACTDGNVSTYTHNSDNTWLKETFPAHKGGAFTVDWVAPQSLNDGETPELGLVSSGFDGVVRFWKYDRTRAGTGTGTTTPSTTVVSTPGVWIENVNIWSAPFTTYMRHMHSTVVRCVAMSPATTSSFVFASCDNNVVKIWTKEEHEQPFSVTEFSFGPEEPVWNVSWSLSGLILAVSVGYNTIKFYKQNDAGKWISFEPENFNIPPVQAPPVQAPQVQSSNQDTFNQQTQHYGNQPQQYGNQPHQSQQPAASFGHQQSQQPPQFGHQQPQQQQSQQQPQYGHQQQSHQTSQYNSQQQQFNSSGQFSSQLSQSQYPSQNTSQHSSQPNSKGSQLPYPTQQQYPYNQSNPSTQQVPNTYTQQSHPTPATNPFQKTQPQIQPTYPGQQPTQPTYPGQQPTQPTYPGQQPTYPQANQQSQTPYQSSQPATHTQLQSGYPQSGYPQSQAGYQQPVQQGVAYQQQHQSGYQQPQGTFQQQQPQGYQQPGYPRY